MATRKKSKKLNKRQKHSIIVILTVIICFFSGALSYYLIDKFFLTKTEIDNKTLEKKETFQEKKSEINLKNVIKKPDKNMTLSQNEVKKIKNKIIVDINKSEEKIEKPKIKKINEKPKLAIIIDDISLSSQLKTIKNLNLKITPSIFPPNKNFKNTPQLAQNLKHFLIHLPLEAFDYNDDLNTILTTQSYSEIDRQISNLRKNFPNAKFINNHTGSKFTNNKKAMDNLLKALKKYGFYFVDSRTFSDTKTQILAPKYGFKYIYRDIFLDNIDDIGEVRKQLKSAVLNAKKNGRAIAIGHPKASTFKALAMSGDILSDIELVYLDEIYEFYE